MTEATKRHSDEATKGFQRRFLSAPSSLRRSIAPSRPGFTLTEILIVIVLIVLLVALAAPALNWMTGSNSVDAAQNTVSAYLGRARNEAIGLQEPVGVFFYQDPNQDNRMTMYMIRYDADTADPMDPIDDYDIELVPDRDTAVLQPGVGLGLVNDTSTGGAGVRYTSTGVIMFTGTGQLLVSRYLAPVNLVTGFIGTAEVRTQFGFGLFEREPLDNALQSSFSSVVDQDLDSDTDADDWVDQYAIPIMVNRYNGTLIRGE